MANTLKPLKPVSLRQKAQEAIRDAIFNGKFQPGSPLRELQLARDLHVSQSTVREALLQLEHTGLVVRVENKQTVVTSLSREEVAERIAIRVQLESMAAIIAARKMGEREFAALDQRLARIAAAIARNAHFEVAQADLDFHRFIWQQSGNETLFRVLDHLTAPLFAFVSLLRAAGLHDLKQAVLGHEPIVAALRSGDEQVIRQALQRHVETSYGEFLNSGVKDIQAIAQAAK